MANEIKQLKVGQITWKRGEHGEPAIELINRYFEENPTNMVDQVAMLTRPATTRRTLVGEGPVRQMYWQQGTFDDDIFTVSNHDLFRIKKGVGKPDTVTMIPSIKPAGDETPSMVATVDNYLWVTDAITLWLYIQDELGNTTVQIVPTPDDIPFNSLAFIAGFVIGVQNGSQRFYWIEPGEQVVDPLNFAEAERLPDHVRQVMSLGDQFALFGTTTTEFWYPSGDPAAPFQRMQGRLYERGVWGGTGIKVGDKIILVGDDGKVYSIEGGPQRISYPGIEERIRKAMHEEIAQG